ncbi:cation-independent mannose-6-phosphate receptor isoform X2 [Drosophila santomea]|uniref:cation-independent mannose-6-phosphate receptor isoform X2 n=1 Tax=Drosophila santomea TaxID=129105 RepID=UPI0019530BF4|nr:cation-independent mannose-6-phosphate receptor isoform X2 [Drosophila santomea]XP_039495376.1 cation-independent mannose-6-phosphate receptor isoform X2 [Drosophila santomea]XP_039495377.1 cation-independent mannose-6-phosphate receptor isoform X2 [Drosophila santomea]
MRCSLHKDCAAPTQENFRQMRFRIVISLLLLLFCCGESVAADAADQLQFSTTECKIKEPIYGSTFDFSGLHSDLGHVVKSVSNGDDQFEFNICGNLSKTCNGESNVAACLKKQGKEHVLGVQHELFYNHGKMYLKYKSGAKCDNGTAEIANYQLHVRLICDYTLDAQPITATANDGCSFYISYRTPLACLSIPDGLQSNSCRVGDTKSNGTFDLMPLSDSNYRTSNRQGAIFVIKVCKPVLYGENSMCPAGSSVCLFNNKTTNPKERFINFGNVQTHPVVENGQLLLRHESPTPCAKNSSVNYTSVIYFSCDKFIRNAHPEFAGLGADSCTYQFNFVTPLACNDLKPCTAFTSTNELLDLSSLSSKPAHTLLKDGKNYTIAVCANAGAPCLGNGGACYEQNSTTISLGNSNSQLRFNQTGSLYLLYEDGAQCSTATGMRRWSTKIEFVCANNATKDNGVSTAGGSDSLKIIEDSNCQLLIQYQTPLACREPIKCKATSYVDHTTDGLGSSGDELIDLTPLISASDNYEARVELPASMEHLVPKTTKFFLNVCRPLVPKYQLGCAGGSAACMAKVTAAGAPEEERSMGFPLVSLTQLNRTFAELLYLKGDPCPSDNTTELSTHILFNCDMRTGRGQPVLRSIEDCAYRFEWATNVFCPPHECIFSADTCDLVHDELGRRFNFKSAPFTKDGQIEIDYNATKMSVNICGEHRKAMTDYSQALVNIFFTHESPNCGREGTMNVQIRLICSNQTESSSTISSDQQCNLLYVQRTPSICEFLSLGATQQDLVSNGSTSSSTSSTTSGTSTTTSSPPARASPAGKPTKAATSTTTTTSGPDPAATPIGPTASVGTILGAILSVTFCVTCLGLLAFSPARRQRVRRLFRRSNSAVRYSRVQSNEEANLLLEPNGEFTESDDDMLL